MQQPDPDRAERPAADAAGEITQDRFLDGRFSVLQPRRGYHRAGLDAVLLAAAVPETATGTLLDFGAGAGVAGLAAAARAPALSVGLVERDETMLALARRSLALPETCALAPRVQVIRADVIAGADRRIAAGLVPDAADWLIVNPPFHAEGIHRASPEEARRDAHVLPAGDLGRWLKSCTWALRTGGRLALIFRADAIAAVLAALEGRFGQVTVHPVCPRRDRPAHRIVVTGIKGSRAPAALMPGLVLHPDDGGTYLPDAEAILRGRAGLPSSRV